MAIFPACDCCGSLEPATACPLSRKIIDQPIWRRHLDRGDLACSSFCALQLEKALTGIERATAEVMARWKPWQPQATPPGVVDEP